MKNEVKQAIAKEKAATTPEAKMEALKNIEVELPLGRPIDPNSERQKRLASYAAKTQMEGTLHRGRPKDPNSANAKKTAEREARILKLKEEKLAAIQAASQSNDINVEIGKIKPAETGKVKAHVEV
jgi:hypothetical protein